VISVIVPVFGSHHVLEGFLGAVSSALSSEVRELIIVDDGSPNSLEPVVDSFSDHFRSVRVSYVRHAANMGRAQARNTGIDIASEELLFFLDVDNHPEPGAFSSVAQYFRDPEVGCVRGNVRCERTKVQSSAYVRFFDSRYLGFRYRKPQEISFRYFATDAVCVRRMILDRVGGFDPRFKHYGCEDEELGIRIGKFGTKFMFAEDARFVDTDTPTLVREANRMRVYAEKSIPMLLRIHPEQVANSLFSAVEKRSTPSQKIFRKIFLVTLQPYLAHILMKGLLMIDSWGLRIPRPFYLYVVAASYCEGVKMRSSE